MPEYIFAYHGGKMPESPEEGAKFMERWRAWSAGIALAYINRGNPVGKVVSRKWWKLVLAPLRAG